MAGFNGCTDAGNVKKTEIVNNLSSGGTTVPLSAEMGKTLNGKITNFGKDVSSGSMHDITEPGIYYLRNSVTDKPTSSGGAYFVMASGGTVGGLFVNTGSDKLFIVTCVNNIWNYTAVN